MDVTEKQFVSNRSSFNKAIKCQERWRQKQIDTYFRKGRPIFKKVEYTFRFFT